MKLPHILSFPVYALDLSDRSYKYACLKKSPDGISVSDFGEGEIPAGVIDRGEIKKPDVIQSIFSDLFRKRAIRFVAFSLPEERGFVRSISLASVKESEVAEALRYQLEEYIPLSPAEAVFDYTIAMIAKDHLSVVVSAFPRQITESYADLVSAAGAVPVCAESELASAFRAVIPAGYRETAMIIDWGRTRTSFSVVEDGVLQFASTVPIGGQALNEAIIKNLGVDAVRAENEKYERGLQNTGSRDVFNAIMPVVASIKEEAERYIEFWRSHSEKKSATRKIFLSGGDANLPGFLEYLSRELGVEVELANPWVNIVFPRYYVPDIELKDSLRFVPAIGLALRGLKEGETL